MKLRIKRLAGYLMVLTVVVLAMAPAGGVAVPMAADSLVKDGDRARDCVGDTSVSPKGENLIRYTVWCGIQSGKATFTVRRSEKLPIQNFSRRPGTYGRGTGAPFHCHRQGEVIKCVGWKKGPVRIHGWIAVEEGSRCSAGTSLAAAALISGGMPFGCPGTRPTQPPRNMDQMRGFRRTFGLDLDLGSDSVAIRKRILGLIRAWRREDPVARYTNAIWGLPLRARDERELEYRSEYLEQFNEALYPWIRLHAQTTYAGYDMDHEHGGVIYVGFVGDQEAQLAAFLSSFKSPASARFMPFPVPPKYSMLQLGELQLDIARQVGRSAESNPNRFIHRIGINTLGNVVEVGTDHVDEVRSWLIEKYGSSAPISIVFSPPVVRRNESNRSRWNQPMVGGFPREWLGAQNPKFCQAPTAEAAFAASADGQRGRAPEGVELLVDSGRITAGRTIYAQLANFRVKIPATFGREFSIERATADGWVLDPASPPGPWPKVQGRLLPESTGGCYIFKVPDGQAPGHYRFSTKIRLHPGTKRGKVRRVAAFEVR